MTVDLSKARVGQRVTFVNGETSVIRAINKLALGNINYDYRVWFNPPRGWSDSYMFLNNGKWAPNDHLRTYEIVDIAGSKIEIRKPKQGGLKELWSKSYGV